MAKNANDVTSIKGDNTSGPFLYNSDLAVAVTASTDFTTGDWKILGYASTDGIDVEQSADDSTKQVWGAALGTVYSNYLDKITLHCASLLDPDMLSVIFGTGAVTADATSGLTTVKVKNRQGTKGTFVVKGKTDDGRSVFWVYRAQTSPNFSYSVTEQDLVTFDLELTAIQQDDGTSSELIFGTLPKA